MCSLGDLLAACLRWRVGVKVREKAKLRVSLREVKSH